MTERAMPEAMILLAGSNMRDGSLGSKGTKGTLQEPGPLGWGFTSRKQQRLRKPEMYIKIVCNNC